MVGGERRLNLPRSLLTTYSQEASESANQTESDPKKAAANAKKEPEKKDDRVKSSPKKPTKGTNA